MAIQSYAAVPEDENENQHKNLVTAPNVSGAQKIPPLVGMDILAEVTLNHLNFT